MKLTLNKPSFVNYLLSPVSKLADNLLIDFVGNNKAKTLVSSSDNSVILLGEIDCKVEEPVKCVIPDCKTFLRLFAGIEKSDIVLQIDSNVIKYKDANVSFKYHLLDESYIVNKKALNEDKLNQLSFDTTFKITKQKLSEIIKFNSIVPDAEKLYFLTEDKQVYAKLGDEQKANTNEIVTEVCTEYQGKPLSEPLPINIQNILLFSFSDDEIRVSVNQALKVFKFESTFLKYIVSGLVK